MFVESPGRRGGRRLQGVACVLFIELNSLFLSTGNLSLCLWKGWGICDPIAPEKSDIGKFPSIFPADQESDTVDEFARDSPHRH
jgi:hypothetical protein